MNWDDPVARFHLLEQIGAAAYNKAFDVHRRSITVSTVNGYDIVPANTSFGRLFMVLETRKAFRTQQEAEDFAAQQPTRTTP